MSSVSKLTTLFLNVLVDAIWWHVWNSVVISKHRWTTRLELRDVVTMFRMWTAIQFCICFSNMQVVRVGGCECVRWRFRWLWVRRAIRAQPPSSWLGRPSNSFGTLFLSRTPKTGQRWGESAMFRCWQPAEWAPCGHAIAAIREQFCHVSSQTQGLKMQGNQSFPRRKSNLSGTHINLLQWNLGHHCYTHTCTYTQYTYDKAYEDEVLRARVSSNGKFWEYLMLFGFGAVKSKKSVLNRRVRCW